MCPSPRRDFGTLARAPILALRGLLPSSEVVLVTSLNLLPFAIYTKLVIRDREATARTLNCEDLSKRNHYCLVPDLPSKEA